MTLYYIGTEIKITYNHLSLFGKIKNQTKAWFTHGCKYVYAANDIEALEKYNKYYFTSLKDNLKSKLYLECAIYLCEEKSDNMKFKLPYNMSIANVEENPIIIKVDAQGKTISHVKNNISATDFRDWWQHKYTDTLTEDELIG